MLYLLGFAGGKTGRIGVRCAGDGEMDRYNSVLENKWAGLADGGMVGGDVQEREELGVCSRFLA